MQAPRGRLQLQETLEQVDLACNPLHVPSLAPLLPLQPFMEEQPGDIKSLVKRMEDQALAEPNHVLRVRARISVWKRMGASIWLLGALGRGLRLNLEPVQKEKLLGCCYGETVIAEPDRAAWFEQEVERKVKCGAWEELPLDQAHRVCITRGFVIPKPHRPGQYRDIWDLRPVNDHLQPRRFRFEGLDTASRLLQRDWWFTTIDLKEAYHHVALHSTETAPFVAIRWRGRIIVSKVLPFGLRWSPWFWTKVLRLPVTHWRRQGIVCVAYMDDLLVAAPTKGELQRKVKHVLLDLGNLGILINTAKSNLEPTQRGVFLGVMVDTIKGVFEVTPEQQQKLKDQIGDLLREAGGDDKGTVLARRAAKLAGRINCWHRALAPARLVTRELFDCLSSAAGHYDRPILLTPQARADLVWLSDNLSQWSGRAMWRSSRLAVVHVSTDASDNFWAGQTMQLQLPQSADCAPPVQLRGPLTEEEKVESSTYRELLAVRNTLDRLALQLQGKSVRFVADNQGTVFNIRRGTTANKRLWPLVRSIWTMALTNDIELADPQWVPRSQNELADWLSRSQADQADWKVDPSVLEWVQEHWGPLKVDRFAAEENHLLPLFNSRWFTPEAMGIDAFAQDWAELDSWLVPPFGVIGRALQHLRESKAVGVLVFPWWEGAWWWPMLRQLAASELKELPMHLFKPGPSGKEGFEPGRNEAWRMAMCKVDGRQLNASATC